MREILVLNPRKRRKTKKKTTRRKTTAKKRTTRKSPLKRRKVTRRASPTRKAVAKKRTTRKRVATKGAAAMPRKRRTTRKKPVRRRRNPSRARRATRAVARRASASFGGMDFMKALKNVPLTQSGMFAAKFAAKLGGQDATETDPQTWDWASYIKGSLGAVGAGFLFGMVKRGSAQKVLEGGLNYIVFKAIQNELIPQSQWAQNWLGADDEEYVPDEYLMTGTDDYPLMFGRDGEIYPADDRHRMLPEVEMEGYGADVLERPGRLGGYGADVLETPGRLGYYGEDPFAKAYVHN